MQTRSQLIDLTVTEVLETTRRAIDRMKHIASLKRIVSGSENKQFWEGYLKALSDVKEIIRDV